MRKVSFTIAFLLSVGLLSMAAPRAVPMRSSPKSHSASIRVDRMPLRIPISVFYDNDTSILSIINNYDTEGEVFIYSCNGGVVDYSPRIESEYILTDYDSGEYVITIVGDNWESTGSFVIE